MSTALRRFAWKRDDVHLVAKRFGDPGSTQTQDEHGHFTAGTGDIQSRFDLALANRSPLPQLPPARGPQTTAMRVWQDPMGFRQVQDALRNPVFADPEAAATATVLDAMMLTAPPLESDTVVYRSFATAQFGDLQAGDVIHEKGFSACSQNERFSVSWGQTAWGMPGTGPGGEAYAPGGATTQAEILVPAGTHVATLPSDEVLLASGSSFTVVSVEKGAGTRTGTFGPDEWSEGGPSGDSRGDKIRLVLNA